MRHSLATALGLAALLAACGDGGSIPYRPGVPLHTGPDVSADASTSGQTTDPNEPDTGGPNAHIVPVVPRQSGLEVEIGSGWIHGVADDGMRIFRGIPYAAPPVGELRFRAPAPVEPWAGVRHAADFGPACPQQPLPTMSSRDNMSEDCLTASVFAPDDDRIHPVMLWLYGGGYVVGGADWSLYDPTELARQGDVVVVSINYRLGALGFLATRALQATDPLGVTGTQGVLDQLEALRWIRRNALAFGGDPYNVTVFGESAGGMSVCALIGSPLADGLFHRAISQSGAGCNTFAHLDQPGPMIPPAFETGDEIVDAVGCGAAWDEVACLQQVPAQTLVDAITLNELFTGPLSRRLRLVPAIDGVVLTEMPIARMQRGDAPAALSAIFGSNADESALFGALDVVPTRGAFEELLLEVLHDQALVDAVLAIYPAEDFSLPKDAYLAFMGDAVFNCGALAAAATLGERGRAYYFDHAPVPLEIFMGTMHAVDTLYLFGTFGSFGLIPTAADQEVSELVQGAWTSFATTGRPRFPGGWPAYAPGTASIAHIDDDPELLAEIRNGRCEQLFALGLVP